MKKFPISASLIFAVAMTAAAQTKFDNYSSIAIGHYLDIKANPGATVVQPVDMPFEIKTTGRGVEAEAGIIVTLEPGASFDIVENAGLTIQSTIGTDMCVATGSIEDIIALNDLDGIKSLTFGGRADLKLDKARTAIGMTQIHAGTDLPAAYKGKGIICGIYDSGIDPNHVNFHTANYTGGSRVKRIFHYNNSTGKHNDYTTAEAIANFKTDDKSGTHGTHTLGCMTGAHNVASGTTSNGRPIGKFAKLTSDTGNSILISSTQKNPYYGMAPEADIAVSCGLLYNINIIGAVGQIVDYAKETGQPAVFNLSVGMNNGPHDGSDALPQALKRAGEDIIICIAAGNEGEDNISVVKKLTAADKQAKTMIVDNTNNSGILEVYGSDKTPYKFTAVIVNRTTGKIEYSLPLTETGKTTLTTSNYTASGYIHDKVFDEAFVKSNIIVNISDNASTNGRWSVSMQYTINYNATTNKNRDLVLGVVVDGNAGQRIDMVNRVASGNPTLTGSGIAGWSDGTPDLSISSLACGENVIVVGAFGTRERWGTLGRMVYNYKEESHIKTDKVIPFTSYGELCDGRRLPHISAPGGGIVSSYNSYYTEGHDETDYVAAYTINGRTYAWDVEQGTSMATPVVSGVIATWLERDPSLKVGKVLDILQRTADYPDGFDEGANPIQAGAGRINAYEGLKEVIRTGAVNDIVVDTDKDIMIHNLGANCYEAFNAAGNTAITVYNLAGQPVAEAASADDTVSVDLGNLAKGIYILNVNGVHSERILVR